jgi:Flp pilus assembly protein TadD
LNTLERSFPFVRVYFVGSGASLQARYRDTFVILAAPRELNVHDVDDADLEHYGLHQLPEGDAAALRDRAAGLVLTDDRAPTEVLLAPVVVASAKSLAAGELVGRGQVAFARGRIEDAERLLRHAVVAEPWNAEALRGLGEIYEGRGDRDRAKEHWKRSLHFDPTQRDLRVKLAQDAAGRGDLDEAVEYLRGGLAQSPDDAEFKMNLERLLASQGEARP